MARLRTDFDVVVVGAGPSGTAAAYRLAQSSRKVLLLDRPQSSRRKPCGGGITIKALNLLPYSVAPVIERATKKIGRGVTSSGMSHFEILETDGYVCTFSVRSAFDQFNLLKAIEAGAEFEHAGAICEIDEHSDLVRIVCCDRTLTARYLIGADGANSVVRRLTKSMPAFWRGFAIEALVDYASIESEPLPEFFFGYVTNGYGWLFPKGDHVNVGIYTFNSEIKLSKRQLRAYVSNRLRTDKLERVVGFPIGFGGRHYGPDRNRVILVGDAAGFAEPLLGEGIHNALKSGQAAADAIIKAERSSGNSLPVEYTEALQPIFKDVHTCEHLTQLLHSNLKRIACGKFDFPIGKTALMRGFAAGKTMRELTSRFLFCPFFRPVQPATLREFLSNNSA